MCFFEGISPQYEALEEVIDPELGLDFVSLGLVYDVEIEKEEAFITFTLGKLVRRFHVADAAGAGRGNPYVKQPDFLLLSQGIGGANGDQPTNTGFPVGLEVKYVRVYQRPHEEARPKE